jgi:hypothetical protein
MTIMTIRRLEKPEWRPFFDVISMLLEAKVAEVEVASLDLGDQTQAEWLPLLGITYDPRDDVVDIALDGLDQHDPQAARNFPGQRSRRADEP